jgi:hypothetical protein
MKAELERIHKKQVVAYFKTYSMIFQGVRPAAKKNNYTFKYNRVPLRDSKSRLPHRKQVATLVLAFRYSS